MKKRTCIIPIAAAFALTLGSCFGTAQQTTAATQAAEAQTTEPVTETTQAETSAPMEMRDITAAELVKEIKIGWNLGNTLDATGGGGLSSETSWGCPRTTKEMMDAVKAEGFNIIRIPVTWTGHLDEDNNIDPFWLDRVKEVVDYVVDENTYAIINIHHESWNYTFASNKERAVETAKKIWSQIAEKFAGYDEHLIFEGQNEPRMVGTDKEWVEGDPDAYDVINAVNAAFYETVRASGGNNAKRCLMIPSYAAKFSDGALQNLVIPDDDRIIVSVHAYIPYNFALNASGSGKFSSEKTGSTAAITDMIRSLKTNLLDKGIPVIIGEMGAMDKDNLEYRVDWAQYFISETQKIGVPCVIWDNFAFTSGETFGLFERRSLTWKYPELMDAYMKAFK